MQPIGNIMIELGNLSVEQLRQVVSLFPSRNELKASKRNWVVSLGTECPPRKRRTLPRQSGGK